MGGGMALVTGLAGLGWAAYDVVDEILP
jgi:hypothetical protein